MRKHPPLYRIVLLSCILFGMGIIGMGIIACKKPSPEVQLKAEMGQVYSAAQQLFRYTWSPNLFFYEDESATIVKLLETLSDSFHSIEDFGSVEDTDPGFAITLHSIKNTIDDSTKRFKQGSKDYALWQLRSTMSHCIACHSRLQIPADFGGDVPVFDSTTLDSQFDKAEYLFATRQFEKASRSYLNIARQIALNQNSHFDILRALKHWLLIEVRVRNRPGPAAETLELFLAEHPGFVGAERMVSKQWIKDLEAIDKSMPPQRALMSEARQLLANRIDEPTLTTDTKDFVKTLRATTILHRQLHGLTSKSKKRESVCLLAEAYYHLPLQTFDSFTGSYLEACIRQFPETDEARAAYNRYRIRLERLSTGSSGLHLDDEDKAKMAELKNIAFGNPTS